MESLKRQGGKSILVKPIFEVDSSQAAPKELTLRRKISLDTLDMLIKDEFEYKLGAGTILDVFDQNEEDDNLVIQACE